MDTVVEVGGWEHECCGPTYEPDTVIELTCLVVTGPGDRSPRYVESHHDLDTGHESGHETVHLRGRVVDISIRLRDGSIEQLERLPSGRALRGFDDHDDGRMHQRWTGEPVTGDSDQFLIAIAGDFTA